MSNAEPWTAPSLRTTYPADNDVLASVRHDVGRWFRAQGFSADTRERASLLISELATNAIEAAPGQDFEVQMTRTDSGVAIVAVTNRGQRSLPPPRTAWGPPEPLAPRGRGLTIAAALSDEIRVTTAADLVTVEVRLSDRRPIDEGRFQQEGWQ